MHKNILKRFVIHPIAWIWDQVKFPVMLFLIFWIAGSGFYHGAIAASKFGELTLGKAMIITLVDLKKDDVEEVE
ncbi:MAG: hypothetical protein ACXWAT_02070 [Methylobacter sp.]